MLTTPDNHQLADSFALATNNHSALIQRRVAVQAFKGFHSQLRQPSQLLRLTVNASAALELASLWQLFSELGIACDDIAGKDDATIPALLEQLGQLSNSLQRSATIPVFQRCVALKPPATDDNDAHWVLLLPYWQTMPAIASFDWVLSVANTWNSGRAEADRERLSTNLAALQQTLAKHALGGSNTMHFARAAFELHIPFMAVENGNLLLGHGVNSRQLVSTITDQTPSIGVALASSKIATSQLLQRFCLPTPQQRIVRDSAKAWEAAQQLGLPVVVKPPNQEQGRGVFAGLHSEQAVAKAFDQAQQFCSDVLVEQFVAGNDYRLTVIHGQLCKVMHRKPLTLIGDDQLTIAELATAFSDSPNQRAKALRSGSPLLVLNEEALDLLAEQGLDTTSIPAAGQSVICRRKNNISEGGSYQLVELDAVHPENRRLAESASELFNLDFAGIDLITTDISQPWHRAGGKIIEVNAQPQLGYRGTEQLYHQLLEQLLTDRGYIAKFFVFEEQLGEPPTLTQLSHLAKSHSCNAFSCADGVWLDDRQVGWHPRSSFHAAQALLCNRRTRRALICMSKAELQRYGYPAVGLQKVNIGAQL